MLKGEQRVEAHHGGVTLRIQILKDRLQVEIECALAKPQTLHLEQIAGHSCILQTSNGNGHVFEVFFVKVSKICEVSEGSAVVMTGDIDADFFDVAFEQIVIAPAVDVGEENRVVESVEDELDLLIRACIVAVCGRMVIARAGDAIVVLRHDVGKVQRAESSKRKEEAMDAARRRGKVQYE